MNVRDTSSHGDTPMCKIWQANVKIKKYVMGLTQICTDRRTDGQTELFLYTPLNFVHGGYNNTRTCSHLINQVPVNGEFDRDLEPV